MAVTLPPGWVITEVLETVPSPSASVFPEPGFVRRTFICTDAAGQYVCASGAQEDCEAQAQTAAQAKTQKQPYYTAR